MVQKEEGTWVVPNPQVLRTFGILNIIFAILLLLFGVYTIVMMVIGPRIQSVVMDSMKEQQASKKAVRDAKIADLKKKEDAAKTKEEKETISDEREAVERDVEPDLSGFMNEAIGMQSDTTIRVYTMLESVVGFTLNVLMIISGIGLLRMSEKGRRLALGVAWLKILRWVAIVIFTLVVIVPKTTEMSQKLFREVDKSVKAKQGGAASPIPMASIAQFTAVATAIWAVMLAILASVYPVLSLWFLTRPAARAACVARAKPAGLPPDLDPGALS